MELDRSVTKPHTTNTTIRFATALDIPAIHRVHTASIRGLCAGAYDPETIESWASNPDMARYARITGVDSRCLVAMSEQTVCGFGSILPEKSRLASLFVHPDQAGAGVGKLLLLNLERLAKDAHITELDVEASLNARDFYARHGYRLLRMATRCLSTGLAMSCAEMRKTLAPQ